MNPYLEWNASVLFSTASNIGSDRIITWKTTRIYLKVVLPTLMTLAQVSLYLMFLLKPQLLKLHDHVRVSSFIKKKISQAVDIYSCCIVILLRFC